MNIQTYGTDPRLAVCKSHLEEKRLPAWGTLHLLPIPSSRDGVHVTGTTTLLDEIPLQKGDFAVGYRLPETFVRRAETVGVSLIDAEGDEEYQRGGAVLTALGTLKILLNRIDVSPAAWRVGIVGFGRIGKELVKLLIPLGCALRVYTGRQEVAFALSAVGIGTVTVRYGETPPSLEGVDLLINTSPSPLFRPDDFKEKSVFAIELASGSVLPPEAHPLALPGLPAKEFPTDAGVIYAEAALRGMEKRGGREVTE